MFKVDENPYFFEEEFQYKVGFKRDHSNMIKSEGGALNIKVEGDKSFEDINTTTSCQI